MGGRVLDLLLRLLLQRLGKGLVDGDPNLAGGKR